MPHETEFIEMDQTKSIFYSKCQGVVNPVNCDGFMGRGLALEFKKRYPPVYFESYAAACRSNWLKPGLVTVFFSSAPGLPGIVFNLPTKKNWRDGSNMEYVVTGLGALARKMAEIGIESVAIPKVGCGLGGLKWEDVRPEIIKQLSLPTIETVEIYLA